MSQRDFYQVLGVPREASTDDIRAAFVRLVKRHHPDLAPEGADLPRRLHEVQQAYRCLSDGMARAAHDAALDESVRAHFARQRSVQRHLRRYDRRHPQALPRPLRRIHWPSLLVIAAGVAILAALSFGLPAGLEAG